MNIYKINGIKELIKDGDMKKDDKDNPSNASTQ